MSVTNTVIARTGAWFLASGIQEPSGGVARYHHSDTGRNAAVSTEITGYTASFLIYAYQAVQDSELLDAALRCARFLTRQAWNEELGIFPFEIGSNLTYFFDTGIIVRGLLTVWRATGDPEFLRVATEAGRGMLRHFRGAGAVHPILTLPDCAPLPYERRWSREPGCYQSKSAMAWFDLFEATGDEEFRVAYETELDRALASHDSFLPGDADPERVMDRLHAYSYFLEAMLPNALRPDCREATCVGIARVARYIAEIAPRFHRSDVYAQLLRARVFAAENGVLPLDRDAANREAEQAGKFQFADGGFGFGIKRGEQMPFVNPVSAAFCAQAIEMLRRHLAGGPSADRKILV